jgi:hypothetical protein
MRRNAENYMYDPEDPQAGLLEAIEVELDTWDSDTLINYAKQELDIEFPEAFEDRVDLIGEIAVEVMKHDDIRSVWEDELRYHSPEELYG